MPGNDVSFHLCCLVLLHMHFSHYAKSYADSSVFSAGVFQAGQGKTEIPDKETLPGPPECMLVGEWVQIPIPYK